MFFVLFFSSSKKHFSLFPIKKFFDHNVYATPKSKIYSLSFFDIITQILARKIVFS